jgi:molybdopterin/thiamine biosynthesis adenylyltransferase
VDTEPKTDRSGDRYHRQTLLPQIGAAGQARLASSRVLLVGCGALGGVIAEQLARAGVGSLRIVDRDVVEWTNLQRQVLFDEADARRGIPKAIAAARRLARLNSEVKVDPVVADLHSGNVESVAEGADLILDGTDNVETRYLINDVSVKHGIPWVYGACVGTEGRVMPVLPGRTACLRCAFPQPPAGADLPTCDTAGVLGPVAAAVASVQSVAAIKLLTGNVADVRSELWSADLWAGRIRTTVVERDPNCRACSRHEFEFLDRPAGQSTTLCGRGAVQVRPAEANIRLDLSAAAQKLKGVGDVELTPYLVRCRPRGDGRVELTLFADGRMIVSGTTDQDNARSLYARYVGA